MTEFEEWINATQEVMAEWLIDGGQLGMGDDLNPSDPAERARMRGYDPAVHPPILNEVVRLSREGLATLRRAHQLLADLDPSA